MTSGYIPENLHRFPDLHPPFDQTAAVAEANRCLYCFDAPCTTACPTHIDVPRFIKKIANDNLEARLFHNGQQIATTDDGGGGVDHGEDSYADKRGDDKSLFWRDNDYKVLLAGVEKARAVAGPVVAETKRLVGFWGAAR